MNEATRAVAAHRLPSRLELPGEPLDDESFAAVLDECVSHRVLGLLWSAVLDGALAATEKQQRLLEQCLESWASHEVRVERLAIEVIDAFGNVGIPVRVLKGLGLAHTVYERSELRYFGDVDLLVAGEHLARAQQVLEQRFDGRRAQPELRPGFDERFGKEVLVRCGGIEVDLHRTFVDGAFGLTVQLADLFAPPYRFPLGGYELEALPMPQRLLHASYAASLSDWPPRLVALRDFAQLVVRERPQLLDLLTMARSWQCEIVLARAVETTWRELELEIEHPITTWADSYQPDRRSQRLLAAHEGTGRVFTRHAAALEVLSGWGDRARYLRAIALPSRAYLRARGLSPAAHAKRAYRTVVHRRP